MSTANSDGLKLTILFYCLVLSLVGVVLIARPPFIFGGGDGESDLPIGDVSDVSTAGATPEQRLAAVG